MNKANADGDDGLKKKLREAFLQWCNENGRTADSPLSIMDWWEEESIL